MCFCAAFFEIDFVKRVTQKWSDWIVESHVFIAHVHERESKKTFVVIQNLKHYGITFFFGEKWFRKIGNVIYPVWKLNLVDFTWLRYNQFYVACFQICCHVVAQRKDDSGNSKLWKMRFKYSFHLRACGDWCKMNCRRGDIVESVRTFVSCLDFVIRCDRRESSELICDAFHSLSLDFVWAGEGYETWMKGCDFILTETCCKICSAKFVQKFPVPAQSFGRSKTLV